MKKPRRLDKMFRDSLIADCISGNITELPIHGLIGEGDLSRSQTFTLLRSWVKQISRLYPGSVRVDLNHLKIDPAFLAFMSTHNQMGTDESDSRKAWAAMRSISDDG